MINFTLKKGVVSAIVFFILVVSAGNGKQLEYNKIELLDSVLKELPFVFPVVVSAGRSTYSVYKALKNVSTINQAHNETVETIVFNSSIHKETLEKLQNAADEIEIVEDEILFPDLSEILDSDDEKISAENMDDIERMLVVLLKKSLMDRAELFFDAIFGEKYKKYMHPLIDLSIPEHCQKDSLFYQAFLINGKKGRVYFERNIRTLADLSLVCYDLLTFIKDLFDSLPQALLARLPEAKEDTINEDDVEGTGD
jgi:hypothetical protein